MGEQTDAARIQGLETALREIGQHPARYGIDASDFALDALSHARDRLPSPPLEQHVDELRAARTRIAELEQLASDRAAETHIERGKRRALEGRVRSVATKLHLYGQQSEADFHVAERMTAAERAHTAGLTYAYALAAEEVARIVDLNAGTAAPELR